MPNWACGNVRVVGEPSNVRKFCELFIFEENVGNKDGEYFARSFVHYSWKDFYKEYLGEKEAEFSVDFAWSCHSCIIEGYPNGKECVTLEWACKEFDVEVFIETEEGGMCFEEEISYTKENGLINNSKEMPIYRCSCGNEQSVPSCFPFEEEECCECNKTGEFTAIN